MEKITLIAQTTPGDQIPDVNISVSFGAGKTTLVTDNIISDKVYWSIVSAFPAYQAGEFLKKYTPIILAAIGVPFNAMTLLIMNRLKPLTSGTFIMMLIAIADISNLLYMSCIGRKMMSTFTSDPHCQAFWTVHLFLQYIAIWLVILLTLERVVAVCFPLKAARICTISNVRNVVLILLILDVLLNVPITFIFELVNHGQQNYCAVKTLYLDLEGKLRKVDAAVFVVIPLTMLSLGNICIIVKLRTSGNVAILANDSICTDKTKRQNTSVTHMLLAVSMTTITCIGPNAILGFGGGSMWFHSRSEDINADAIKHFVFYMIVFITYINNAVNFILYVLSGRRFRAAFLQILGMPLMLLH